MMINVLICDLNCFAVMFISILCGKFKSVLTVMCS